MRWVRPHRMLKSLSNTVTTVFNNSPLKPIHEIKMHKTLISTHLDQFTRGYKALTKQTGLCFLDTRGELVIGNLSKSIDMSYRLRLDPVYSFGGAGVTQYLFHDHQNIFEPVIVAVCRVAISKEDFSGLGVVTIADTYLLGHAVADALGFTKFSSSVNTSQQWITISAFRAILRPNNSRLNLREYEYIDLVAEVFISPKAEHKQVREDILRGKLVTVSFTCTMPEKHTDKYILLCRGNIVTKMQINLECPKSDTDLSDKAQTDYEEILSHYPEISGIVDSEDLDDTKVLSAGALETLHQINTNPRQYGFVDDREIALLDCQMTGSHIGSCYRDTVIPSKGPYLPDTLTVRGFNKLINWALSAFPKRD